MGVASICRSRDLILQGMSASDPKQTFNISSLSHLTGGHLTALGKNGGADETTERNPGVGNDSGNRSQLLVVARKVAAVMAAVRTRRQDRQALELLPPGPSPASELDRRSI
jgi:hypothetical protein